MGKAFRVRIIRVPDMTVPSSDYSNKSGALSYRPGIRFSTNHACYSSILEADARVAD
jgi:hypothetical protein